MPKEAERWKAERNTLQNPIQSSWRKHCKMPKQGKCSSGRLAERVDSLRVLRERNPGAAWGMIDNRNKVRGCSAAAVESFLQEAKCLPSQTTHGQTGGGELFPDCSVWSSLSMGEDVGEQAFEQVLPVEDSEESSHQLVKEMGDGQGLKALCTWSENVGKVDGVNELLKQAEINVAKEMDSSPVSRGAEP
ncbi:hypothetical protein J4Q44_G00027210 [Coregonus suidteri]|uniref:Uncharacterized protein n=1 Tax=Coregonus suidteri TaxID=861788 RepID=A0AAN8NGK3_9TELE